MKKSKVKFLIKSYGVVRSIENDMIYARIYDSNKHEIIDDITFSVHEFSESDKAKLDLWCIFTMNVGYIGNKPFKSFKLKKLEKCEGIGKERSIALSLRCYDMMMRGVSGDFTEAE